MAIAVSENAVLEEPGPEAGRLLRVLWMPRDRQDVALIELGRKQGMPFWEPVASVQDRLREQTLLVKDDDPFAADIRCDADLTAPERAERDRRWNVIGQLVGDPRRSVLMDSLRGMLVAETAIASNVHRRYVYEYLRAYWQRGQVRNALVPAYASRGGPGKIREPPLAKRGRPRYGEEPRGGINVDADVREKLEDGVQFLLKGQSWKQAYDNVLRLHFGTPCFIDGRLDVSLPPAEELPTLEQFKYWAGKKLKRGDVEFAVVGEAAFARNYGAVLGTSSDMAAGPGQIYQIDATIADIFLRSRKDQNRLIGRPVLYLVIDHYSRMIVGFSVGLSGPNWEGAMLALENAMTDKVRFGQHIGIPIKEEDWPAQHVCRELLADRGPELVSVIIEKTGGTLGFIKSNAAPYRPDLKGIVESRFNFINNRVLVWVPGATHERERGSPRCALDERYTLDHFAKLIAYCILLHNATFRLKTWPPGYVSPDGRDPTPLDLWNFGCRYSGAPQKSTTLRVRAALLRRGTARETEHGLYFKGLHYECSQAIAEGWFVQTAGRTWRTHDISYDPRDVSTVFLMMDRGRRPVPATLTSACAQFRGWSLDEVLDFNAMRRAGNRRALDDDLGARMRFSSQLAELDRQAAAAKECPPTGNVERGEGVRQARAEELRERRSEGAWTSHPRVPSLSGNDCDNDDHAALPDELDRLFNSRARVKRSLGENQ